MFFQKFDPPAQIQFAMQAFNDKGELIVILVHFCNPCMIKINIIDSIAIKLRSLP